LVNFLDLFREKWEFKYKEDILWHCKVEGYQKRKKGISIREEDNEGIIGLKEGATYGSLGNWGRKHVMLKHCQVKLVLGDDAKMYKVIKMEK